jgi:hypothetical protein
MGRVPASRGLSHSQSVVISVLACLAIIWGFGFFVYDLAASFLAVILFLTLALLRVI